MGRRSVDQVRRVGPLPKAKYNSRAGVNGNEKEKEKEYMKSLRPAIWLTDEFPLRTKELLPLLDILANKVKAVRRCPSPSSLRELFKSRFSFNPNQPPMNSIFTSFDFLLGEFLGLRIIDSTHGLSSATPTVTKHSLGSQSQGACHPSSSSQTLPCPQRNSQPRFAPELDGLNCYETLIIS
ncbi:hypothetical protein MLD38_039202 [Melastoma candidum]|uniref:Uncharacterized protein n=1 Tax=Melastoma candidum TaxID=119954 RepID=A0ACB9L2J0_9MYRT|nr:hypothetical protein MLD38_039202 [Melastoma candidum]